MKASYFRGHITIGKEKFPTLYTSMPYNFKQHLSSNSYLYNKLFIIYFIDFYLFICYINITYLENF